MFSFAQRARTKCIGLHSGIQFLLGKLYWCSQTDREVDIPYQCNYYGAVYAQPLSSKEGVQLCGLFLVLFSGSSASTINKWRPEVDQRGGPANPPEKTYWGGTLWCVDAPTPPSGDSCLGCFGKLGVVWLSVACLSACLPLFCLPVSCCLSVTLSVSCPSVFFYCRFPCHLSPVYSPYV